MQPSWKTVVFPTSITSFHPPGWGAVFKFKSISVTTMETSRDIDSGRNIEDENVAEENVAVPGSSGEGSHIVSEEDELKKLGLERPQVLDARHNAESQRHRPTGSTDSSVLNRSVTNQNTSQPDGLRQDGKGDICEQNALRKRSNLSKYMKKYNEETIKRVYNNMGILLVFSPLSVEFRPS
ncbi:hypothetical protein C8Q75DRAFT_807987 [Abortiporus biennis]|nr:hypothetical protein C8Q75DRAFT_807987 [Abortiporus biennis]